MCLTCLFSVHSAWVFSLISPFRAIYDDKEYFKWRTGYDYPQNQLRNVARETSLTHYTLSLDVDVILAQGKIQIQIIFTLSSRCLQAICQSVHLRSIQRAF